MRRQLRSVVLATAAVALIAPISLVSPGATSTASAAPAKYSGYYRYFNLGARPIPLHDTQFAPQGLTNWGENKLIIGYYDISHPYGKRAASRIAIVDRASLRPIKILKLNTQRHVSGLATTNGYLWVVVDSRMIRYATAQLGKANGSTIHANGDFHVAGKGSYAFGQGENVWTGTCDPKHRSYMYRYSISHGKPTKRETLRTPARVQGVAVTSNRIVWSSSWSTADSRLIVWPRHTAYNGSTKIGRAVIAPPRSEGIAVANGHLHLVYESSAKVYQQGKKKTTPVIRSIHHGVIPPL